MKKSKFISLFLAILIFALCSLPAYAAIMPGDVDNSSDITAEDARAILRYAVGLDTPSASEFARADVNSDGYITASDARAALRLAVELDSLLTYTLYPKAHPLFEKSFPDMHPKRSIVQEIYHVTANWCCFYTVRDVFRPALKDLGYSDEVIEKLAPSSYSSDKLAKAARSFFGRDLPISSVAMELEWYIPSLLADYYRSTPEYAETYVFWDYYDDIVENGVIEQTSNASSYKPRVGDIVFMSNKLESYIGDTPTIDHTAQIIRVNDNGTFLCTEGGIIQNGEDGVARVRERTYYYDDSKGTYIWELNDIVSVLMVARPLLP
ncbi:MAG: hypothetical protein J1E34_07905 [Oscillospiraceae bacterium]|nr:hypothetical protein [Oscillospiraceae bacterium]